MTMTLNSPSVGDVNLVPCWPNAGAPTSGTSGTHAGLAEPGDLLMDTTNHNLYVNTNTKASPTWSSVVTAGAIDGTVVGGVTPAAGAFTTVDGIVGSVTPAAGTFTTVTTSGLATAASLKVDAGTKTATASGGAVTLAKLAGVITTESLTTAQNADYTLTITNSLVAAADQAFASVANGSNSAGSPVIRTVTPGASSLVIVVRNIHASAVAFNGTLLISFFVLKN